MRRWPRLIATTLLIVSAPAALGASERAPALSRFAPAPDGLVWLRQPIGGQPRPIAKFPATNTPVNAAWSPDGTRGLVWYDADKPAIWEVTLATGAKRSVPPPPAGALHTLGYDQAGRLAALTQVEPPASRDAKGPFVRFEGVRYALPDEGSEGLPALALGYRWSEGWKRVEVATTTTGWDYAQGVDALKLASQLGPRTDAMLEAYPDGQDVKDRAVLGKLNAIAPRLITHEGQWQSLSTSAGPLYVYQEQIEFVYSTNLLAYREGAGFKRLGGLEIPNPAAKGFSQAAPELRLVTPEVRGRYVLISDRGDGEHPRLFDMASKKLAYRSDTDRAVVFWP